MHQPLHNRRFHAADLSRHGISSSRTGTRKHSRRNLHGMQREPHPHEP